MSFIAAVRVRVEREGRRGGFRKKKRESKGRSKHTLQYVYVCFTLFFLSFPFRQSFIFFFCCCVCALQGQQALTSHSLTRVTAHVTFKTKRPSKKTPKQTKKQRRLNLGSAGRDAAQPSRARASP